MKTDYEINYFFGEESLNEILIDVLLEKLREKYLQNEENDLILNCSYFSLQEGGSSV